MDKEILCRRLNKLGITPTKSIIQEILDTGVDKFFSDYRLIEAIKNRKPWYKKLFIWADQK